MIASIFNHLETPPLYLATYIICSTYFHPLPSKKTPLLFFLVSKSQKQKKMGKTYRYKNMFEGHICCFKSPTKITTKIGELGRAPLSPKSNRLSNRLPEPGTAMERLRKRCRWFFLVSPQADLRFGPRSERLDSRGFWHSHFLEVVVLVKPPNPWKSEDLYIIPIKRYVFVCLTKRWTKSWYRLWLFSVFTSWPNKFTAGIIKVSKIWSLRLLAIRPTHSASSPDRLVEQSSRALCEDFPS